MPAEPILRLESAFKTWSAGGRSISILKGIDLEIFAEESVAVIGPSGAGKSTLLHVLGCLTPLDQGSLWVDGQQVPARSSSRHGELHRLFGFVFQDGKLIPDLDVLENVCVPLVHRGIWPARQRKLAREALAQVGLEERGTQRPDQLSSGEIMRVAIARALVTRPRIVLADEPTGNLDSVTGQRIVDLLFSVVRDGRTLVLVTHDEPLARQAQRLLHMKDGILESRN